jgi:hypothetical protein
MLRHLPLSLTGSLIHVEEALTLLIELLYPSRRKLATSLGRRRTRRWRVLSIRSRTGLTIRAIGLLVLRWVLLLRRILLLWRVRVLLMLSIRVWRSGRRILRLVDIACLLGLCTRQGQQLVSVYKTRD